MLNQQILALQIFFSYEMKNKIKKQANISLNVKCINITILQKTSFTCLMLKMKYIRHAVVTSLSQPPQRSMCSVLFDVKRLWAAFQLAVCYSDCDSRVHRWVCLVFHPPKRTDVTHSQCAKLHWEMASCDCNEMASGFNPHKHLMEEKCDEHFP